jgi:hypothetical protein
MIVDRKLEDLTEYGGNIIRICQNAASYLLKKRHLIGGNHNSKLLVTKKKVNFYNIFCFLVDKRNTIEKRCEHSSDFIESGGKFTLAYHLGC